jgi:serine/threonine protein kinase
LSFLIFGLIFEKMRAFGDYIITKEIGEGGMGRVYRAWKISDAGFRKLVAIKTLKSTHNTDLFINEAKISARFDDENIVKTTNFGKISGEFFIEMEYIRGINLKELMETVGEIPLDVFFYIAEKLLTAVSYIHRFEGRGLVHRDVNPKNILISWIGGVKLSDFGITLPQNSEIDPFGKISYVPPEVILGRGWTQQGDIWSIGVVFWEMLTGQKLFPKDKPEKLKEKILKGKIPPPSSINPAVPELLDDIVLRALSRNEFSRFPSADRMLDEMKKIAVDLNVHQLYQKDFSNFVCSFFSKRIDEENREIEDEEKRIISFISQNQNFSGALNERDSLQFQKVSDIIENTKEKLRSNESLISKRKKEKSEGGSSKINSSFKEVGLVREEKNQGSCGVAEDKKSYVRSKTKKYGGINKRGIFFRRKIYEISVAVGLILGFLFGVAKSISDIKSASDYFRKGIKLIEQRNFDDGRELIEKALIISGFESMDFIQEIQQEHQQVEKQKNIRRVAK